MESLYAMDPKQLLLLVAAAVIVLVILGFVLGYKFRDDFPPKDSP